MSKSIERRLEKLQAQRALERRIAMQAETEVLQRIRDMCEHGWSFDDWDRLAGAAVAGHIIECGAQATGGLWCNWQESDLADVGYPIAEIAEDGSFTISKPQGTGGAVNRETVSEQLLYEVGDPARYLTPDVTADFTSVRLEEAGPDLVRVSPARGQPNSRHSHRTGYSPARWVTTRRRSS